MRFLHSPPPPPPKKKNSWRFDRQPFVWTQNEGPALVKCEILFNLINRNTYIWAELVTGDIIRKVLRRRWERGERNTSSFRLSVACIEEQLWRAKLWLV